MYLSLYDFSLFVFSPFIITYRVTKDSESSESLLFVWNLNKNVTVVNLTSFEEVPKEANLTLCTQSACAMLPPIK